MAENDEKKGVSEIKISGTNRQLLKLNGVKDSDLYTFMDDNDAKEFLKIAAEERKNAAKKEEAEKDPESEDEKKLEIKKNFGKAERKERKFNAGSFADMNNPSSPLLVSKKNLFMPDARPFIHFNADHPEGSVL